jgi:hypothetical protein
VKLHVAGSVLPGSRGGISTCTGPMLLAGHEAWWMPLVWCDRAGVENATI